MRTCSVCRKAKPLDAFSPLMGGRYRRLECKPCRNARSQAERDAVADPARLRRRLDLRTTPAEMKLCLGCEQVKPLTQYTPVLWNQVLSHVLRDGLGKTS